VSAAELKLIEITMRHWI